MRNTLHKQIGREAAASSRTKPRPLRSAEKPTVNEALAKELTAAGMVEGEHFIVSKVCRSYVARGRDCFMCGKYIKRRDQRCR